MVNLRSRCKLWGKANIALLVSLMYAAPVLAECAELKSENRLTPVPLGSASEPRPTLTIDLTAIDRSALRSAVDAGKLDVRLSDVRIEGTEVTGFRVFVNDPNASTETSIDSPAYAESVAFFPTPSDGELAGTFVIDLDKAVRQITSTVESAGDVKGEMPFTVTLVPTGSDDARIGISASEIVSK